MKVLVPLIGGILSGIASKDFKRVQQQPPSWIFAPVWTVLYIMMGMSLVLMGKDVPFVFWVQLGLNLIWSPVYTRGYEKEAFYIILALLLSIILTIATLYKSGNRTSAYLLIPYLLWVTYATTLNYNSLKM